MRSFGEILGHLKHSGTSWRREAWPKNLSVRLAEGGDRDPYFQAVFAIGDKTTDVYWLVTHADLLAIDWVQAK